MVKSEKCTSFGRESREIKKGFKKSRRRVQGDIQRTRFLEGFTSLVCEEYEMGVKKTKRVHSQFQIERNEKM